MAANGSRASLAQPAPPVAEANWRMETHRPANGRKARYARRASSKQRPRRSVARSAWATCCGNRTGGAMGFGSSPRMNPKSMWKNCPRRVMQRFSRCRSPIPRMYVTTQLAATLPQSVSRASFSSTPSRRCRSSHPTRSPRDSRSASERGTESATNLTYPDIGVTARTRKFASCRRRASASFRRSCQTQVISAIICSISWSCRKSSPTFSRYFSLIGALLASVGLNGSPTKRERIPEVLQVSINGACLEAITSLSSMT
mmetsp:Transcript_34661/g.75609  ORF Transcript_34661/g.75609 Transcript_34661/m.75609 type:complete len:258 (-) Transcript_34661:865-1638(-)